MQHLLTFLTDRGIPQVAAASPRNTGGTRPDPWEPVTRAEQKPIRGEVVHPERTIEDEGGEREHTLVSSFNL
jgi:hypothetical protein